MDVTALSKLYYDQASSSILPKMDSEAANGLTELSGTAQDSGFEKLFSAARDKTKALGAAANSGATDVEHVSKKPAVVDRDSPLYKQCRELEGFLLKNLLSSMRKTVAKTGLMGTSFASDMYEDMLYDEYANSLAASGGFGLADQAYLELSGQRGLT